jgi:hypothetical protein
MEKEKKEKRKHRDMTKTPTGGETGTVDLETGAETERKWGKCCPLLDRLPHRMKWCGKIHQFCFGSKLHVKIGVPSGCEMIKESVVLSYETIALALLRAAIDIMVALACSQYNTCWMTTTLPLGTLNFRSPKLEIK